MATPTLAGIQASVDRGTVTDLTVSVPSVSLEKMQIDGKKAVAVKIDGTSPSFNNGMPDLPLMSGFVMISNDKEPQIKTGAKEFEVMELDGVVKPSKGSITRNIDPNTVPYVFGEAYGRDEWIPADKNLISMSEPFIFRDIRGVRVTVSPVQYNPQKNQLRIYKTIHAQVTNGSTGGKNVKRNPVGISKTFEPLYKKLFLNFSKMAVRLPRLAENGRLVIISPDEFYDSVLPLMVWKKKCGIDTKVVKLSQIGGAKAEAIKAFLQNEFNTIGFTHVILVGDAAQLPTNKGVNERAASDPCYVKLAGDDNVPDAIISRISATLPGQVAYQVAKFINYEQFPSENDDAAWYSKAMGIASAEGSPADFERMDILREQLIKSKFSMMDQIYDARYDGTDSYGYQYSSDVSEGSSLPGLSSDVSPMMYSTSRKESGSLKEMIAKGVDEGRALINYIGHGSKNYWVTSGFSTTDCQKLANGWKLPLIISVACVNGDFVGGSDCFAEAWMKAGDIENPKGAIGIFGSTTNQDWIPPCDVQTEINLNYIINDTYRTAGALVMNGIMKGLEMHGTEAKSAGVRMLEQWHWFGDCTTMIRTRVPSKINVKAEVKPIDAQRSVEVTVVGLENKPVEGAQVTCYTAQFESFATARTNAEGKVVLAVSVQNATEGFLTVVGPNLVPVVDQKLAF